MVKAEFKASVLVINFGEAHPNHTDETRLMILAEFVVSLQEGYGPAFIAHNIDTTTWDITLVFKYDVDAKIFANSHRRAMDFYLGSRNADQN